MKSSQDSIVDTLDKLKTFLLEKNRKYGDSALHPLALFSKHFREGDISLNLLLARCDDKLSRIANADTIRENDLVDLIGYLILLSIKLDINIHYTEE